MQKLGQSQATRQLITVAQNAARSLAACLQPLTQETVLPRLPNPCFRNTHFPRSMYSLELKDCFVMMRRLPRNPRPLSLGTVLALGHLQCSSCWRPIFGFPFRWNPLTRKSSFPPSLWLTLPAWNLPPQHPLLDSCTVPSRM